MESGKEKEEYGDGSEAQHFGHSSVATRFKSPKCFIVYDEFVNCGKYCRMYSDKFVVHAV